MALVMEQERKSFLERKKKYIIVVLIIAFGLGVFGYLRITKKKLEAPEIIVEEKSEWEKLLESVTASSNEEIEISQETLESVTASSNEEIEISQEALEKVNASK